MPGSRRSSTPRKCRLAFVHVAIFVLSHIHCRKQANEAASANIEELRREV